MDLDSVEFQEESKLFKKPSGTSDYSQQNGKGGNGKPKEPWMDQVIRDRMDAKFGFSRFTSGTKIGWLVNMHETIIADASWESGRSAVDFYFIEEDGGTFKVTLSYSPYFLLACEGKSESDVAEFLRRKFENTIESTGRVVKENLDLPNHLVGNQQTFVKVQFRNSEDLDTVKRALSPHIAQNQKMKKNSNVFNFDNGMHDSDDDDLRDGRGYLNAIEQIMDMREYDVPYATRMAIDHDYRVGMWYSVVESNGEISIERQYERVLPADPVVFAFDIETTKLPLKFPDSSIDCIMMISYMIDRQGYLITNREIVSADIDDFDYSPKPGEFDGPFIVFNEPDEKALLHRFFDHIVDSKPTVFVTYNGDFFDWPFIEARARANGLDMFQEIGWFQSQQSGGDYQSFYASHMDCFRWVKRDSYLPVGSQGLKAVTKAKLGYDPKELDPELMTPYAADNPHVLADYSVSDAVATFYLYMKYVHPFIFSLCNIIPLAPDNVLRKGSGTLCEMLLMVEAYKANVIMPNKHRGEKGQFFDGHYLAAETYVGGHVEALESGIFRSDLPNMFRIDPDEIEKLIMDVDKALRFSIRVEEQKDIADIENFDEVKNEIISQLEELKARPNRNETPLIYHLDVGAMYPNIILTNRLQPPALVSEEMCALCDFNVPENKCQRKMEWSWRGEFYPADRTEFNMIKNQLQAETFPPRFKDQLPRKWSDLTSGEQSSFIEKRLKDYSRKVYNKVKETKVINKKSIVCQRENSFYIDTVRNFRDRRYEYKGQLKQWKKKLEALEGSDISAVEEAKKMIVLKDSLQLAHKCILNSFYGYVMRKGSRWYSMEMAGIVCLTGAKIIQMARQIVEGIGRPLELDTDGIWCILPKSFPETFSFKHKSGKSISISYPCIMLNHLVHEKFTNHQYQVLTDPDKYEYDIRSENSIFFEVDGPYKAMILPASTEENKLLKKRYAVFNEDGSMAELKGFEVKRRGELKIIKIFQEEVFHSFLEGSSLQECYSAVARVADRFLDILFTKGQNVPASELMEYISENRSMSKTLEEYGEQKSTSITTAKRLAELLGGQMVKNSGLACHFIISDKPSGAPVAERAIPVAVFSVEENLKKHFLRKWLRDSGLNDFDLHSILDWNYYIERLGSTMQKLITIPAAMQSVDNPIPRLPHPEWLHRQAYKVANDSKQRRITDVFKKRDKSDPSPLVAVPDLEDMPGTAVLSSSPEPEKKSQAKALPLNPYIDYSRWLKEQQKKWRAMIKAKKDTGHFARVATSGVASFLNSNTKSIMGCYWEIIQIVEADGPGQFRLWALVNRTLRSFKLQIDRSFLVNCRARDESGKMKKVGKTLPRSLPTFYLYEISLPEPDYQANSDAYQIFSWHHDTVGVFETQMQLSFRFLLSAGCLCVANRSTASRKSPESVFTPNDLLRSNDDRKQYLSGDRLQFGYLYHSKSDSRQIFGIFFFRTKQAKVIVVDTFKNPAMPRLAKLYRDRIEEDPSLLEGDLDTSNFAYPEEFDFDVEFVVEEKAAFKSIQKFLLSYQDLKVGPSLLITQTQRDFSFYPRQTRILWDFPNVPVTSNARDSDYPALDWQKYAATRMLRSLTVARDIYTDKLYLSRYSQIPMALFDDDPAIFVADVQYSRILSERNVVSWYSPTSRPDIGGREEDDNAVLTEGYIDPEYNYSSYFGEATVEFEVDDLAVNAILQAAQINELEGAAAYAGLSNSEMLTIDRHMAREENLDWNMPSFMQFKCLKDTVRQWAKEAHLHNNPVASVLLKNCYRWLSSPTSKMYDPCLLGYVRDLMKKVLLQILGEFRRLGSKIAYASFEKLVIVTSKTSIDSCIAYTKFVTETMRSNDAFAFVSIRPRVYWRRLLWVDPCNFVGLGFNADDLEQPHRRYGPNRDGNMVDEDEDEFDDYGLDKECGTPELKLIMEWSNQEFYPPYIRQLFTELLEGLISRCHSIQIEYDRVLDQQLRNELQHKFHILVSEELTRQMLDTVPQIQHVMLAVGSSLEVDPDSLKFPTLPGTIPSITESSSPALEYIKASCHVFSLLPDCVEEARIVKRQLLRLVGVAEFSEEAEFKRPSDSFLIRNVICSYCQYSRDVDLAFDYELKREHPDLHTSNAWRCPKCMQEYDMELLEEKLVEMVHESIVAYQIQDLQCVKCRSIKRENARMTCKTCASPYVLVPEVKKEDGKDGGHTAGCYGKGTPFSVLTRDNLKQKLKLLGKISSVNQMKYLQETVDWIVTTIR